MNKQLISAFFRFELVVTIEGLSASTGKMSKTSTSYMSTEIRWGSRFQQCIKNTKTGYYVDHKLFNQMEEFLTPLCSAKRLHEVVSENYFCKEADGIYTPSSIYSPVFNKTDWPRIQEHEEESSDRDESGIDSWKNEVASPMSTRSNYMIAVAQVHHEDQRRSLSESNLNKLSDTPILAKEKKQIRPDNISNSTKSSDEEEDFMYAESDSVSEHDAESKENIISSINEADDDHSPYARRKPFTVYLRSRSTSTSSRPSSIKRNSETLLASLQSYTSSIFTRQTSRNVTETDF